MKKPLIIVSLVFFFLGCRNDDFSSISKSIKKHYRSPSDSLKLKAAIFLLENIPGLHSLDPHSMSDNEIFYNYMKVSTEKYEALAGGVGKRKVDEVAISKGLDSIVMLNNRPPKTAPIYLPDSVTVTEDLIIKTVDDAFWAWKNLPWAKNVTFDEFKEYILPYRVINTYWPESRSYFIKKYESLKNGLGKENMWYVGDSIRKDIHLWYKENGIFLSSHPYLNPLPFENILKCGISDCYASTALRVTAMRSMGIPVAYEAIPQWGNGNSSHFFYKILTREPDTINQLVTNENIYRDTRHIVDGSSFNEKLNILPSGDIPILYNKSVPKVFRKCFSIQSTSLASQTSNWQLIPPFFRDDRLLDVTKKYVETSDINIMLTPVNGQRVVYLCVFNPHGWNPVDWALIHNNKSTFKGLGKNIVYLPAYYVDNKMLPANSPFIIQQDGIIKTLEPSKKNEQIKLKRKYRFTSHNAGQAMEAIGIRFQGANDNSFKDTTTLFTINDIKYNMTEVLVNNLNKFRYCLMQFSGKKNASIAELEFWGLNNNGKEILLKGRFIGNEGRDNQRLINAFDKDRATYFGNKESGIQVIGIDLGRHNRARITKIRFCPRNDTNNILPDEEYELFYWQTGWKSLGSQIGVDLKPLSYVAPKNALFWLKNNSKGSEERIFTYDKGTQMFW